MLSIGRLPIGSYIIIHIWDRFCYTLINILDRCLRKSYFRGFKMLALYLKGQKKGFIMKYAFPTIIALIVGLYTSLVAMFMWNWFAVPTFNLPNVSFFQMLGLTWLINLLFVQKDKDEDKWTILFTTLEHTIPEEKKESLNKAMNEVKDNFLIILWAKIGGQIIGNTLTLILGFFLHALI